MSEDIENELDTREAVACIVNHPDFQEDFDSVPTYRTTGHDLKKRKMKELKINYINNRDFYYQYEKQDTIQNFNFSLAKSSYDSQKVFLNFDFVPEYFRSIKNETLYSLVSIDYRIIDKKSGDLILEKPSKKFRTNKRSDQDVLNMSLLLKLEKGEYNIHLKVEDHNGNRIAEKNIEFIMDSNNT